jgi:hypothetical protein
MKQGEPVVEPEVDLSNFLERQRLSDGKHSTVKSGSIGQIDDDDDVDHTLDRLTSKPYSKRYGEQQKGKVETLEWDDQFESLARDKKAAEANWGSSDIYFQLIYTIIHIWTPQI